jgi:hypothetical protein
VIQTGSAQSGNSGGPLSELQASDRRQHPRSSVRPGICFATAIDTANGWWSSCAFRPRAPRLYRRRRREHPLRAAPCPLHGLAAEAGCASVDPARGAASGRVSGPETSSSATTGKMWPLSCGCWRGADRQATCDAAARAQKLDLPITATELPSRR